MEDATPAKQGFSCAIKMKNIRIYREVDGIEHEFEVIIQRLRGVLPELVSIKHRKGCNCQCFLVTSTYDLESFRELIEDSSLEAADLIDEINESEIDYDSAAEEDALEHQAELHRAEAFEYGRGLRGLQYD